MIKSAVLSTTFICLVAIGFSSFATSPSSSSSCSIEFQDQRALGYIFTAIDGNIASGTTCIQDGALLNAASCFLNINSGESVNVTVTPDGIVNPKSQTITINCNASLPGVLTGSIVFTGMAYQSYTSTCAATTGITYSGCGTVDH